MKVRSSMRTPCHGLRTLVDLGGTTVRFGQDRRSSELYDASGDGRTGGWRTIDVTRGGDEHPYAAAWWPDSHGLGYEHSFVNQAADILAIVGGGTPVVPMPDFADALKTQQVLHAAIESARQRSPIQLSDLEEEVS